MQTKCKPNANQMQTKMQTKCKPICKPNATHNAIHNTIHNAIHNSIHNTIHNTKHHQCQYPSHQPLRSNILPHPAPLSYLTSSRPYMHTSNSCVQVILSKHTIHYQSNMQIPIPSWLGFRATSFRPLRGTSTLELRPVARSICIQYNQLNLVNCLVWPTKHCIGDETTIQFKQSQQQH